METLIDEGRGQSIGSHVRMKGKMMGVELLLDEVITERQPPYHKTWETVGPQRLLVIDSYRLGFDIAEQSKSSELRVFIDYNLPATAFLRWLGFVLGKFYAKWCVHRMIDDASKHFASLPCSDVQSVPSR